MVPTLQLDLLISRLGCWMLQILVLKLIGFTETHIRIALGVRVGGVHGGMPELLSMGVLGTFMDRYMPLNDMPLPPHEDVPLDGDEPIQAANVPISMAIDDNVELPHHQNYAELIKELDDFMQANPQLKILAAHDILAIIGRMKEARGALLDPSASLPPTHAWRRLMPMGSNSSIRRRTWVENMHGNTRRALKNRLHDMGERWRFVPLPANAVQKFRPKKSKPKNTLKHNVVKNFVQASFNREKRQAGKQRQGRRQAGTQRTPTQPTHNG